MLTVSDVSKTYANGVRALSGVTLSIGHGLFGLLGPNGAGKSTLMRTIATLQEPDTGSIRFGDRDVLRDPDTHRHHLGYLPQDFDVYPGISALALLDHLAVLKGVTSKGDRRDQVNALLLQTNLHQHRHKAVSGFSGGMKQRFGVAQALLGNPQLLIVDEPTAGLDPEERNRFHNLLGEIGENVVVILSTHIVEDVRQLCSRMAILAGGQVVEEGDPARLCAALDGRVWTRVVPRDALARYRETLPVLSERLSAGKTVLRVIADAAPATGFEPAAPELEDVYFAALAALAGGMIDLLAFEWRYHTRQLSYFAAAALICGTAFVLVSTRFGPANLFFNSPYVVMYSFGMLSLVGIFLVTVLSANGLLRDTEHRMSEIIFATPVTRWRYLLTRFIGVVMASLAIFLVAGLVLMLAPRAIGMDPEFLGPVHPWSYAWALLVLALPNLVIATAIVFAVAATTRSTLATWVGGVLVYALYFVTAMLVDSPLMAGTSPPTAEALARAAILDPFGLSAFFEQTRYWTPAERDTRLLSLSGNFLWNRVLWLAVAFAILALTVRLFRMRSAPRDHGRKQLAPVDSLPIADSQLPAVPTALALWPSIRSAARLDIRYALASRPSIALMLLWLFFISVEMWSDTTTEYGSRMYPTTALMLDTIALPLARLGALVLIFFGAELVWRARASAMDEILDATPASPVVFYLAHLAALTLLVVVMAASAVLVAVGIQLVHGYHDLMLPVYASLFWTAVVPLAILSVLILLLNVLSPNRYVGMFLSLMAVATLQFGVGGIEHPLARYGAAPVVTWSDLSGFSSTATSFAWFTLYWGVVAALLATVTVAAWRRGREASFRRRVIAIPHRLGRRGVAVAGMLLVVAMSIGGFIYYQVNIRQRYVTREAMDQWRAAYERKWRGRVGASPDMVAITSKVDLYPAERRFTASGTYRLENRTAMTIDTVWISVRREARDVTLALDSAGPVATDTTYGMYGFVPAAPLAPGDSAIFTFSLAVRQPSLRAAGFDESLAANGTFLINTRIFPWPGFNRGYEIDDSYDRRRLGLPVPAPADRVAPSWITFETTVSTAGDQVAIAPGTLEGEWEEDGRRYFHYRSGAPMVNWFAFASARYDVKKVTHDGVAIEVYYHPAHSANVDRMIAATATSLDLFGAAFGPYPRPEVRIVEVPSTWQMGAAVAFPGTIFFVEDRGFLTDARDSTRLDIVTRRVAHEVAHQWWGMQLSPAPGPGATMLVESFAKYGEQRVLAVSHGEAMVGELMQYDQDRYLSGRTGAEESEVPLMQAGDESWLYYGKGGVVMNALRALVGQEALDRSLQRLLQEHGGPDGRATAADFLAILHEEVPEEHHAQVDEWLGEVVLYDLSVPAATASRLPDGRYEVTVELEASKMRGDSSTALDETVDVAVYGADSLLALEHPLLSGKDTTLSISVSARPIGVTIDPFVRRLDRERSDNERKVNLSQP